VGFCSFLKLIMTMCGPGHLVIKVTRQAVSKILFVSEDRAADIAEACLF